MSGFRPAPPADGLDYLIHLAAMSEVVARQQDLANFVTVRKRMSVGDCSDGVSVAVM